MRKMIIVALLALVSSAAPARAQHDHGGMQGMPAQTPMSPEAAAKEARAELTRKLTKLQEKIDALDEELGRTDLKPAKRKKLEAKLKKLLEKKDRLIEDSKAPAEAGSGGHERHH
ncbi:MAG: hypothetical protein A2V88_16875 [Elusimicrobia bacterium RBG_16_66_12]|nr:MAG: hypothetical protein A2V88_16875 [Elusimicrobia bacterium RBG_16_66_12]